MGIFSNAANNIIKNMIIATMPMITVKSGLCRYNFRCQMNAVNDAIENGQDKIAMCFYFSGDSYPVIHFLNIDNDGNYIDNTLGIWSSQYDYYLIRTINKDSFFEVNNIFTSYRKELRRKLPFYIRIFTNYEN